MQVLTIVVQAVLVGWLVFVLALSVGMARRTLEARRRRRGYWEELCRSSQNAAWRVGARVRVVDQSITGTILRTDGARFVVLDDDRDTWRFDSDPAGEEGTLTYGADALRPIEGDDRD